MLYYREVLTVVVTMTINVDILRRIIEINFRAIYNYIFNSSELQLLVGGLKNVKFKIL